MLSTYFDCECYENFDNFMKAEMKDHNLSDNDVLCVICANIPYDKYQDKPKNRFIIIYKERS